MRLPTPRIEDATLKRKFRIQVIFAFLAMLSWYLFLYSNNLLEYMEQDLGENYQEILNYTIPFLLYNICFLDISLVLENSQGSQLSYFCCLSVCDTYL